MSTDKHRKRQKHKTQERHKAKERERETLEGEERKKRRENSMRASRTKITTSYLDFLHTVWIQHWHDKNDTILTQFPRFVCIAAREPQETCRKKKELSSEMLYMSDLVFFSLPQG